MTPLAEKKKKGLKYQSLSINVGNTGNKTRKQNDQA